MLESPAARHASGAASAAHMAKTFGWRSNIMRGLVKTRCTTVVIAPGTTLALAASGDHQIFAVRTMTERSVVLDVAYARLSVEEVIRDHHEALIGFLRRRLSIADDAYDVAQEAYIRMMKYEGSREIKSPSAMLYKVAVNIINDLGRAAKSRFASSHTTIEGCEIESELPSAERDLAGQQELDILLDAIEQLPPKCRQVFLLSRAHGMTYPEIARHCGISVKMVEKHISRALAHCLKEVGGEGVDTS